MVESTSAFLYPYTSVHPYDIDAIVASTLLYDNVHYLSYWESTDRDPLFDGIFQWEGDETGYVPRTERIKSKSIDILQSLRKEGILRPLSYRNFNPRLRFSPRERDVFDYDKTIGDNYQDIVDTLKHQGFAQIAKREGKEFVALATCKFAMNDFKNISISKKARKFGGRELIVDWIEGIPILIMYANWAAAVENHSPFAFDKLHADALNSVMKKRTRDKSYVKVAESQLGSQLKNLFYGEFMELALPNLRNCFQLSPQKLLDIRENTHELRKKFLEGLSQIYSEYIEGLEPTKYGQAITITEQILPRIAEYREELQRFSGKDSVLSAVKGEIFGFFAEVAALGMVHLCLPSVLDPLGLSIGIGVAGAEKLAKSIYEKRKRPDFTVQDSLSSIVFYMDELGTI